jgi:predicted O-linked N-acetylglucosamine transferase (SPINDLY family)
MAVKIEDDDAQAPYNLATALEVLHIFADAVQNYDRAAELMPDSKAVLDDRALCMEKLERSLDLA